MKILKNIKEKLTVLCATITGTFILANSRVLAASNTQSIDSFINFACDWLTKIRRCNCLGWGCNVCFGMAKRRCRTENLVD